MGNKELYSIIKEKEKIYSKTDFTDEDGIRVADLEDKFLAMNGWDAESDAEKLLNGLGVNKDLFYLEMRELKDSGNVRT